MATLSSTPEECLTVDIQFSGVYVIMSEDYLQRSQVARPVPAKPAELAACEQYFHLPHVGNQLALLSMIWL